MAVTRSPLLSPPCIHSIVYTYIQVFEAGMRWLLQDPPSHRRHVFTVLAPVRFPIIPVKQLDQYIHTCEDFSLKIALQKLVQDYRSRQCFCQQGSQIVDAALCCSLSRADYWRKIAKQNSYAAYL